MLYNKLLDCDRIFADCVAQTTLDSGGLIVRLAFRIPRGRVFISFLGSYIIVLLIPIIIGFAAYREVVINVEQNANEKSLMTLNQCMAVLDKRFEEIDMLASQLAANQKVLSFAMEQSPYVDRTVPTKINDLRQEMAPYISTNNFISDIDIYFNKSDVTISSTMPHLMLNQFYGDFFVYGSMTSKQWTDAIINKKHFKEFYPEQDIKICTSYSSQNFSTQKMMMYIQSFPFSSMDKGFVMILIADSKIREMLNDVTTQPGGWVYITDSKNNVMASYNAPVNSNLPMNLNFKGMNGFMNQTILGQNAVVTYTTSTQNGWRYVAVLPQATVMLKARSIKNFIILVFGIALLVGIAGAFALSYRNLRPIRKIIANIRSFLGAGEQPQDENEYSYLNKSILDLLENNQHMKERLKRQQPLLKTTFVERLLEGSFIEAEDIQWMIEQLGFTPLSGPIAVAIAKIGHSAGSEVKPLEEVSVMKLLLVDAMEEKLGNNIYYRDLDFETRILIFSMGEGQGRGREYVDTLLHEVSGELMSAHGFSLLFTVGSLVNGYSGIEKSYEEAREALDYKTLQVNSHVVWFCDIPRGSSSYFYPMNIETHLTNYSKLGNYKEIERLIHRVHKENFIKHDLSPSMVKLLSNDIFGTIVKVLEILAVEHGSAAGRIRDTALAALEQSHSVEELFTSIQDIYRDICEQFAGGRKSRSDVKDRILEYVRDHFADSQLCLTSLADEFDFAPAYLSQLFKDSTGENFSVFVEKIRIEKACELLETGTQVSEVASQVGYNSVYVFRNAFKRVVGLPPSEYRGGSAQPGQSGPASQDG